MGPKFMFFQRLMDYLKKIKHYSKFVFPVWWQFFYQNADLALLSLVVVYFREYIIQIQFGIIIKYVDQINVQYTSKRMIIVFMSIGYWEIKYVLDMRKIKWYHITVSFLLRWQLVNIKTYRLLFISLWRHRCLCLSVTLRIWIRNSSVLIDSLKSFLFKLKEYKW